MPKHTLASSEDHGAFIVDRVLDVKPIMLTHEYAHPKPHGEPVSFAFALELECHMNQDKKRETTKTVVIQASDLGPLLEQIGRAGTRAQREFISEMQAALQTGHDKAIRGVA